LQTYTYDAVGNRINETSRTQSKTITLITDANGQTTRTEQVSQTPEAATTATFNARNELTQLNEPNGISTFAYDNNGNLNQVSKNANVISRYEYDVRNQLTSVKDGNNNELAKFDYDFERKRISKQGANGYESYAYAGSQIVNEYNAYGDAKAKYTIGAGEVIKSEFGNSENNFHFTDALGSVTSLANATGALTSRNEYNAFGELSTTPTTANSIGYTGQRLDNETGLMALGNGERYYSPSYARFIQQDSFSGVPTVPQSLNRFSYVHNNPTKHTDPSGNIVPAIILGVLVVGALFGGGYSYANQKARIADGTMKAEDFSWSDVIESAGWGGLTAGVGLALAVSPLAPVAVPLMIGAGIYLGGKQIVDGAGKYGEGKKNEGAVDMVFGSINLALSLLGARSYIKSKIPLARETSPPQQKQLTDGGAGNRKLLNAAPEEVVNPTKKTRLIVDESGNVKDVSTGRGNLNKASRAEKPIELFSKEEPYLDAKLLEMEVNSQPATNAHYRGKHGAQTTPEQQYNRAVNGIDPISGMPETYANGNPKPRVSSTRFLSARDQMRAINRAKAIYEQQIQSGKTPQQARFEAQKPIKFSRVCDGLIKRYTNFTN
jgi:RHS repeat-associated protein